MRSIGIAILILLFVSCDRTTVVGDLKNLDGSWNKDEVVTFSIPQLDSLKRYHMFLNVRNTNEYKYNNLFLIVSMNFPHGRTIVDTLEYRMAHPDGSWMGEGIGTVIDNKLWYKENISFTEEGEYTLSIQHAVRNNGDTQGVTNLEGITDVGFSIEEATQPE